MKKIIILFSIIALFYSCKKDSNNTPAATNTHVTPSTPDSILYTDFMPDLFLRSVDHYANNDPCQGPFPTDSTSSLGIDVDHDSLNDFVFEALTNSNVTPVSIHCYPVVYRITLAGINYGNNMSYVSFVHPYSVDVPVAYDTASNHTIDSAASWLNTVWMSTSSQSVFYPPYATFSDCYVGIKINNKYGWIHVAPDPLNGIIIKECALNLTDNNSIQAGQKQ